MIIKPPQIQNRIYEMAEMCQEPQLQSLLETLSSDLLDTVEYEKQFSSSWDLPSIIVGALGATAISLLLFAGDAKANSFDVNITSEHADKSRSYNKNNFGLGYTYDVPKNSTFGKHLQLQGGFFKNSYDKTSLYALANLKHDMNGWQWGVAFGFVTGYDDIESEYKPMQSKSEYGYKSSSRTESDSDELHEDDDSYKGKDASHSHAKNLNAIQFMVLPNITWKITKKHALQLTYVPSFSKDTFAFAGLKYQYTIGK